jgi:ankyrin repeat protein
MLLERRANVDAKDKFEGTVLHRAAESEHEVIVRLLLDNYGGRTALQAAVKEGTSRS